jgi:hypothetical protein
MDEAAAADLDVELISYGHSVIQAANLHVALASDARLLRAGRSARAVRARREQGPAHGAGWSRPRPQRDWGSALDDETIDDATIAVATANA